MVAASTKAEMEMEVALTKSRIKMEIASKIAAENDETEEEFLNKKFEVLRATIFKFKCQFCVNCLFQKYSANMVRCKYQYALNCSERLANKRTKGKALEAVQSILMLPSAASDVIETLQTLFGSAEAIIYGIVNKIRRELQ